MLIAIDGNDATRFMSCLCLKEGSLVSVMGADHGPSALPGIMVRGSLIAPTLPMVPSLGPHVHLQGAGLESQNQQTVMALQSGLSHLVCGALNNLALQSCHEKDDAKKEPPSLARVPGLVTALVHVILDWRSSCSSHYRNKTLTASSDGEAGSELTQVGRDHGRQALNPSLQGSLWNSAERKKRKQRHFESYWEEDAVISRQRAYWTEEGLLNCDEQVLLDKRNMALAASNILRNLSFWQDNEVPMAQNRRLVEVLVMGMEDPELEFDDTDQEWVTNSAESFANLAPHIDLRILEAPEASVPDVKHHRSAHDAVVALKGMLNSPITAFHVAGADALARLVVSPDNERFIMSIAPEMYPRAVMLMATGDVETQAVAVGLLYNLAEVDMACKVRLAGERWAAQRLLKLVRAPHPQPDVCRKAMLVLENMASEPQNRPVLTALEHLVAEIAMTESRVADVAARILRQLSADTTTRPLPWGSSL